MALHIFNLKIALFIVCQISRFLTSNGPIPIIIIGLFKFVGYRSLGSFNTPTFATVGGSTGEHVHTVWLAPSTIHFLRLQGRGEVTNQNEDRSNQQSAVVVSAQDTESDHLLSEDKVEGHYNNHHQQQQTNNDDYENILPYTVPKKLQVTEKDGLFIALDNNSLKMMRQMEKMGHCSEVEVEVVPLSKVPPNIVDEIFSQHSHHVHHSAKCKAMKRKAAMATAAAAAAAVSGSRSANQQPQSEQQDRHQQQQHQHHHHHLCQSTSTSVQHPLADASHLASSQFSLNSLSSSGSNSQLRYLSESQRRSVRMSNTVTVNSPCLRHPITTSTQASDANTRQHCCNESHQHSQTDDEASRFELKSKLGGKYR